MKMFVCNALRIWEKLVESKLRIRSIVCKVIQTVIA